ncbi:MAG: GNAT family N-acetyltransferase [Lachnospiraceae bacterium]|nr:GNAT family N-acetyltransferase [Lachnospiraceae bacterium]
MAAEITICKTLNPEEYLKQIDMNDADTDFINAVSENDENIYSVLYQESTVGLALSEKGRYAFLYIYIFSAYRHRGFGRVAALLLEQELYTCNPVNISTYYRTDNCIANKFAKDYGYIKEFSSDYMVYSGPCFEPMTVPVRQYKDEDYPEAHSMYAEAFHLMRLSTGCFQDSVPEPASEEGRKYWSDTENERLVFLNGEEIVGYAHIEGSEIGSVSVKPDCQGKGIGKVFVKYIVNMLINNGYTNIFLYCVVGNNRAKQLYDELGFITVYRNDYAKKKIQ